MEVGTRAQPRRRSVLLITALVAYTLYTLARTLPQIAFYWIPQGDFGISDMQLTGVVEQVSPHSAAFDAGLRVGDRIDMRRLSLHQLIVAQGHARAGEVWPVWIVGPGNPRSVSLIARPVYFSKIQIRDDLIGEIMTLLRVVLGFVIVLLKPARITWLFYLASTAGLSDTDLFTVLPGLLFILASIPSTILTGAVSGITLMFCLVFPHDQLTGWRRRIFPFVVSTTIAGAAFELAKLGALFLRNHLAENTWVGNIEDSICLLLGASALIAYYFESSTLERDRVRLFIALWIIGTAFVTTFELLTVVVPAFQASEDFWVGFVFYELLITIVFGYMVLRQGMFDVEFVLSRGVVYGILGLMGLTVFAGIDIAFASLFSGSKVEVAVDIAIAIALGFGARAAYGRLTDFVDRTLFRQRYEARRNLRAALEALATANTPHAIEEVVTNRAASALGLASAVFFRRLQDGGLLREQGTGWPPDSVWHLLSDDRLVRILERKASRFIDLRALGWSEALLDPPQQPVVAIPMVSGSDLIGVTLYGSRLDGVLPSPDTINGLVELSRRAGYSYRAVDSSLSATTAPDLATARSST